MRIELGGETVTLDRSGCAIFPRDGIVCIEQPGWPTAHRRLFPTQARSDAFATIRRGSPASGPECVSGRRRLTCGKILAS